MISLVFDLNKVGVRGRIIQINISVYEPDAVLPTSWSVFDLP